MSDASFWQERYESKNTRWDLGKPSPHFQEWLLKRDPERWMPGRIAIPGCGRGHDVAGFARAGFQAVGYDFAPEAILEAQALYGDIASFVLTDVLQAPPSEAYTMLQSFETHAIEGVPGFQIIDGNGISPAALTATPLESLVIPLETHSIEGVPGLQTVSALPVPVVESKPEALLPSPDWGHFDYVAEHTCFCAIHPSQRAAYQRSIAAMLKPGGRFLGIFWEHDEIDGPPYSTNEAEIRALFGDAFDILSWTPHPAIHGRSGTEHRVSMQKRDFR